jgi:hypothetical protein
VDGGALAIISRSQIPLETLRYGVLKGSAMMDSLLLRITRRAAFTEEFLRLRSRLLSKLTSDYDLPVAASRDRRYVGLGLNIEPGLVTFGSHRSPELLVEIYDVQL